MSALLLDDGAQHLGHGYVFGLRDHAVVGGQRGQLVHGSPRHVDRHEVTVRDGRPKQCSYVAQVTLATQPPADPPSVTDPPGWVRRGPGHWFGVGWHLDTRLAQEPAERLAMPELLVVPAAEEGRTVGSKAARVAKRSRR